MDTSVHEYRPSINIIRDSEVSLDYIPTPNTQLVYDQLIEAHRSARKSFNIIGAYGTGKSAFIWAFEQSLAHKKEIFEDKTRRRDRLGKYQFFKLVGEHQSVIRSVAGLLGLDESSSSSPKKILKAFQHIYQEHASKGEGIVLVLDEFGKFLEFAAKNDPDGELYFLQMLAEFFNDPEKDAYLITTLHQDFSAYALSLSRQQRREWDKVKGRYKELVFNEPVEQLLFLAAKRQASNSTKYRKGYYFSRIFSAIEASGAFPLNDYLTKQIAKQLLPMDILSAGILTHALQKFGQNQRSLFSFLEANDHLGLDSFEQTEGQLYYSLHHVFDYLEYNFHSLLSSWYNPEKAKWAAVKNTLAIADRSDLSQPMDAEKILKAIGLLYVFAPGTAHIDHEFMVHYIQYVQEIEAGEKVLNELVKKQIIRFSRYQGRYLPNEGTDLDIEMAIDEAGNLIQRVADPLPILREHIGTSFHLAKASYFSTGIPRLFKYHLSDFPEEQLPLSDQVDGHINLIFSAQLSEEKLLDFSASSKAPILYGWYQNTTEITNLILEIQKVKKVKSDNSSDRIAIKELESILGSQIRLLNHYLLGNQYGENSPVIWCYGGQRFQPSNSKDFNQILSQIAHRAYPAVPIFRNEMVNRTKISSPINTARKQLIRHMLESANQENLGFDEGRFPPEKTIYLSLLKSTGMHRETPDGWELGAPSDPSFQLLWEQSEAFLRSSLAGRRSLGELVDLLKKAPFKLKNGFIGFWLPVFLFIRKDEYALFSDGKYIPYLSSEILQLIHKAPEKYQIKAFQTEGVHWSLFNQYRSLLQLPGTTRPSNNSLIETIKPFLAFYRQLPFYTQNTKKHLSEKAHSLREAIAKAKDPEALFFEIFPRVMKISIQQLQESPSQMEAYIAALKDGIRELRTAYIRFLDRVESFIANEVLHSSSDFSIYKTLLQKRLHGIESKFIRPELRVLRQRINSPLDDRDSWLASIGQAIIGKPLDRFSDEEEHKFFAELKSKLDELFSLQDLSQVAETADDEVFKVELLRPGAAKNTQLVRIKPEESEKLNDLTQKISGILEGADQNTILAVLARLWEQQ